VLAEDQLIGLGEVLNGRDLGEHLGQAIPEKPIEGFALDSDQIGKGEDFGDTGERNAVTTRHDDLRQELPLLEK